MTYDTGIRAATILIGAFVLVAHTVFTVHRRKQMAPSQFVRSCAYSALLLAVVWGTAENLMAKNSTGPRNIILITALVWGLIAVILPSSKQQFTKEKK